MAYNDEKIKLDASQKHINEKFKNNIEDTNQKIFWYIKFSLPLDETSVTKKTMKVTDTKGYILKTNIIYNKSLELIVIESLQTYKEDEYYILHITKDVKSENKQNLKKDVHILFKIKGGEVVEFKELAENVLVPRPRKKPKISKKNNKSKVYSFHKDDLNLEGGDKLPFDVIKFNPFIAVAGVPLFIIGVFMKNNIFIAIGSVLASIGFMHIIMQISNRKFRSIVNYNLGVISFNKGKFKKAKKRFKKAAQLDAFNEFAEYALNKVSFFL